jgi:hypothetical protein
MPFRRTKGIVTDSDLSDPKKEADVIMSAAALGFAASSVKNGTPIRFDIDPKDRAKDLTGLQAVVAKIDKAVVDYLKKNNLEPGARQGEFVLARNLKFVKEVSRLVDIQPRIVYNRFRLHDGRTSNLEP